MAGGGCCAGQEVLWVGGTMVGTGCRGASSGADGCARSLLLSRSALLSEVASAEMSLHAIYLHEVCVCPSHVSPDVPCSTPVCTPLPLLLPEDPMAAAIPAVGGVTAMSPLWPPPQGQGWEGVVLH